MKRTLWLIVAVLTCVGVAEAGKLKTWTTAGPQGWDASKLSGVVLSQEGVARLSRRLEPLPDLGVSHVWAVIADSRGGAYLATGGPGQVMHLGADGVLKVLYQNAAEQVLALAIGRDGALYAGTGPSGLILRISPGGQVEKWCATGASYVWALAWDETRHRLIAGTGPQGQVLSVDQGGKPSVLLATAQAHVLSLACLADGVLAAGTSPRGLIYRIDRQGAAQVWFQAPQNEVRTLLADGDALWAGTSSSGTRLAVSSATTSGLRSSGGEVKRAELRGDQPNQVSEPPIQTTSRTESAPTGGSKGSETFVPAPSVPVPTGRENSVYRLTADGAAREVLRTKALILSLAQRDGRLLVGTGGPCGQVFEVMGQERVELLRLDHGQVLALALDGRGELFMGTGDTGRLYRLAAGHVASGTLVSDVADAKALARWGLISWQAELPPGTRLSVAVRGGNVSEPDATWTPWSAEFDQPQQPRLPATRFLQYRVTLSSDSPAASPLLRSVTVRYQTLNLPPEVTALDVPDVEATPLEQPKKLKLKWTAVDPNDDELVYSVQCRKEGWTHWVELAVDLEKREFEWDTTTLPSGRYQVRVVASDAKDNGAEAALTGERLASVVVSHEPPKLTAKVVRLDGDRALVEVTAESAQSRLISAAVAHNGGKWRPLFPTDGLFDSRRKTLVLRTEPLRPGQQVLVIRVTDAGGNTAATDCVFVVKEKSP